MRYAQYGVNVGLWDSRIKLECTKISRADPCRLAQAERLSRSRNLERTCLS